MAVITVVETTDREAGDSVTGARYARDSRRTFHVQTNDFNDGPYVARRGNGVPRVGSRFKFGGNGDEQTDQFLRCVRVQAKPVRDEPCAFTVVCDYSTDTGVKGFVDPDPDLDVYDDPLMRPYDYEWGSQAVVEPFIWDLSASPKLLASSAGEAFDPPLTQTLKYMILTVTRNEEPPPYLEDIIPAYKHSLNQSEFLGWSPHHGYMGDITARAQFGGNIWYWRVRYEMHFRNYPWDQPLLDRGKYQRIGEGELAKLDHILDRKGLPITEPVLLDNAGKELPWGQPAKWRTHNGNVDGTGVYKLAFQAQWNDLDLLP